MPSDKTKKLLEGLNKITDSAPKRFQEDKFHSYTNRYYPNTIQIMPSRYDKAKRKKDEDGEEFAERRELTAFLGSCRAAMRSESLPSDDAELTHLFMHLYANDGRPRLAQFVSGLEQVGLRVRIEQVSPSCGMARALKAESDGAWGAARQTFSLYVVWC